MAALAQLGCDSADYHTADHHHHHHHHLHPNLQYVPCMYDDYVDTCHHQQPPPPPLTTISSLDNHQNHALHHVHPPLMQPMDIRRTCYGPSSMTELRNRRNVLVAEHHQSDADQCHGYEDPTTTTVVVSPEDALSSSSSSSSTTSSQCDADADGDVEGDGCKQPKSGGSKSAYKHVPHRDKPPHLVERRNARERRRVQAMNSAFVRLRKCVPVENRNKRISKVKTLQKAIEYISYLEQVLADDDDDEVNEDDKSPSDVRTSSSTTVDVDKENTENMTRWISVDSTFKEHNPCISMYDNYVQYPL